MASKLASGLDLHDVEFKRRRFDATAAYAQSKQACKRYLFRDFMVMMRVPVLMLMVVVVTQWSLAIPSLPE